jgi:hypothetical protein
MECDILYNVPVLRACSSEFSWRPDSNAFQTGTSVNHNQDDI